MASTNTNKICVTKLPGAGDILGYTDPRLGLQTNMGEIVGIASGNYTVLVTPTSGTVVPSTMYPVFLSCTYTAAVTASAFPSGTGDYLVGHGLLAAPIGSGSNANYYNGAVNVDFTLPRTNPTLIG